MEDTKLDLLVGLMEEGIPLYKSTDPKVYNTLPTSPEQLSTAFLITTKVQPIIIDLTNFKSIQVYAAYDKQVKSHTENAYYLTRLNITHKKDNTPGTFIIKFGTDEDGDFYILEYKLDPIFFLLATYYHAKDVELDYAKHYKTYKPMRNLISIISYCTNYRFQILNYSKLDKTAPLEDLSSYLYSFRVPDTDTEFEFYVTSAPGLMEGELAYTKGGKEPCRVSYSNIDSIAKKAERSTPREELPVFNVYRAVTRSIQREFLQNITFAKATTYPDTGEYTFITIEEAKSMKCGGKKVYCLVHITPYINYLVDFHYSIEYSQKIVVIFPIRSRGNNNWVLDDRNKSVHFQTKEERSLLQTLTQEEFVAIVYERYVSQLYSSDDYRRTSINQMIKQWLSDIDYTITSVKPSNFLILDNIYAAPKAYESRRRLFFS